MIFWDTSAVIPLVVNEPFSRRTRRLAQEDPALVVWWGTLTECESALARREREASMTPEDVDAARELLATLSESWYEVLATDDVRQVASLVLRRHPLRAADALQLAAALTWAAGRPAGRRLVTFDDCLADAARGEGFDLALSRR